LGGAVTQVPVCVWLSFAGAVARVGSRSFAIRVAQKKKTLHSGRASPSETTAPGIRLRVCVCVCVCVCAQGASSTEREKTRNVGGAAQ
jgi:hypothetical protein